MFARFLELDNEEILSLPFGFNACGFCYEPSGFVVDRWSLDFLRWKVVSQPNRSTGLTIPTIFYDFIEYKPSKPTNAYLSTLARRFATLCRNLAFYDGLICRSNFYCYYGSVFNTDGDIIALDGPSEFWMSHPENAWTYLESNWIHLYQEEISNTRFDLLHAP
jgi:hypothetical protein